MNLINLAIDAALKGGQVAKTYFRKPLEYRQKSPDDFVSEADVAVEQTIREILLTAEGIGWHGEETGESGDRAKYWLVDPIDGTANFIRGVPIYAISIALMDGNVPTLGVIYFPEREELFYAEMGKGAYMNGKPIKVSGRTKLEGSIIATGFPFRKKHLFDGYTRVFTTLYPYIGDLRRMGAAAIDLAYSAAGIFDGFFEFGLSPWDIAAGILLVKEAGGSVYTFAGSDIWDTGNIIAGTPVIASDIKHMIDMALGD
ncbi:inositol monophosphatase [bacterium 3DAC]|nr:inositol monophosphatase [bacterium 3DAC]